MSQWAESSGNSRATSRLQGGAQAGLGIAGMAADSVGNESGLPLIVCPDCGLERVIEGRTKKENENHGRVYFKCPRNGYPKLCGYYRFDKAYFNQLKSLGVIQVRDGASDIRRCEGGVEQKLEALNWKMNMVIVCVIVGIALMSVVMK